MKGQVFESRERDFGGKGGEQAAGDEDVDHEGCGSTSAAISLFRTTTTTILVGPGKTG